MTAAIREHLNLHATALTLREQRNEMLASNIANAATPGYKARDIDFNSALQAELGNGDMRTSNGKHFANSQMASMQAGYRVPTTSSMDGNTVEMGVEQLEFAENTVRYQTSLALLNRKISGLATAIKGE